MYKSKEKLGVAQHKGPHFSGELCAPFKDEDEDEENTDNKVL